METPFFIDFHCHPAMKPFGKSFTKDKVNSSNVNDDNSIYYYDPPDRLDKIMNITCTLTKFSQSDLTTLFKGNVKVIAASLSPIEKNFFTGRFGPGNIPKVISNFITEVGKERAGHIQIYSDYFLDFKEEYDYYNQLNGKPVQLNGKQIQYRMVRNYNDIRNNIHNNDIYTISVIPSAEGCHVFNSNSNMRADEDKIINNIGEMKKWTYMPLFVSITHHFYNELCGHAESLSKLLKKFLDQSHGMDTGFTSLGWKVLETLLDDSNSGNNKRQRIHIDIKHLSLEARKQYYSYLDNKNMDVPIIVSHGAVNGLESFDNREVVITNSKRRFLDKDINFFDDELVRLAKSNGIFCLQLDERRVSDKERLKKTSLNLSKKKMLYKKSGLLWHQIRHIAEVLDKNGLPAWKNTAVGSDFDGIVDPLNGFWTSEDFPSLEKNLVRHARDYMHGDGRNLQLAENKNMNPEELINRIMCTNSMQFLERFYN